MDIHYLRPWARHCITDEEGNQLLLPFSADDVKKAVFDIAEDKAPGPDGYSSRFYKAAWPVVGEEVTRAVLEFFSTGKLLKQINSTILALIPKLRIEQDMQLTYHWKCESSKIFQLGFADDLLLFYRADFDFDSIRFFKEGLDWYAELSGLRLNIHKSHLIISRSAQDLKDQMLGILGFQEGHLSMRYLGLPLITSRLSISDCQPLISKIDARINGWEGISLSYAGRVQIIKSMFSALSLYWASAFILPKKVINEIEKRLRIFLWKGTTSSGYAKVAWKDVCRPTDEGGLGFKDISTLNRALMSKKLCDVIRCDRTSIWVQWLYQDRLRDTSIWTVREHGGSWGWRKMLRLHPFLRSIVNYRIGDGGRFYIWQHPWHHLGPFIEQFPRGPNHLGIKESAKLSLVISAGEWQWPSITDFKCLEITHNLPFIFGGEDRVVWRIDGGQPTTQALYRLFDPPVLKVGWSLLLAGSLKIPRHSFILWLAILGKLPSTDKP
ncbi:UNVERIFIED_CONTAM: LINE-1 reverse transcriptase [Sesamum indicum]